MKKRTGLAIAGGILEIIAGVNLLGYALWALYIFAQIPNGIQNYNWDFMILFVCIILFGILAIVGRRKSDLNTFGIINLAYIGYFIYKAITATQTEQGVVAIIIVLAFEMILLLIASFLFFFSKKTDYEVVFDQKLKAHTEQEPQESKKTRRNILLGTTIAIAVMYIVMLLTVWLI